MNWKINWREQFWMDSECLWILYSNIELHRFGYVHEDSFCRVLTLIFVL
jgi:hypothetical protein